MHRSKMAAAAIVVTVVAAVPIVAINAQGQERRAPRAAQERRGVHVANWFGSQIGVTVREAESGPGVVVDDVRSNSPAESAGVKEGDVIVEFDGERVRSTRQFSRLVDETPRGRAVKMTVERGGQRTTLEVSPEAREFGRVRPAPFDRFEMPEIPRMPSAPRLYEFDSRMLPEIEVFTGRPGRLGVQLEDIDGQLAEYFGVKRGALVTSVAKDSAGERAGLKAGDVITKVAAETVDDTGDVRRELRRVDEGKEFTIEVVREKKPVSLKVKLDARGSSKSRGTVTDRI